jgi:hypothetical protein
MRRRPACTKYFVGVEQATLDRRDFDASPRGELPRKRALQRFRAA